MHRGAHPACAACTTTTPPLYAVLRWGAAHGGLCTACREGSVQHGYGGLCACGGAIDRVEVQVVGRLVEQQHPARLHSEHSQVRVMARARVGGRGRGRGRVRVRARARVRVRVRVRLGLGIG